MSYRTNENPDTVLTVDHGAKVSLLAMDIKAHEEGQEIFWNTDPLSQQLRFESLGVSLNPYQASKGLK